MTTNNIITTKNLLLILSLLVISIPKTFQKTSVEDRIVKIKNIALEHSKVNNYKYNQNLQISSTEQENIGKIQFYPISQYWKIDFLNNGLKLINFEKSLKILQQTFEQEIGTIEINEQDQSIKSLTLKKPQEKHPNFEHSKLKNKCWRIDIYPQKYNQEEFLNFKFCVATEKEDETIGKYRHVLEDKSLGKKNNE